MLGTTSARSIGFTTTRHHRPQRFRPPTAHHRLTRCGNPDGNAAFGRLRIHCIPRRQGWGTGLLMTGDITAPAASRLSCWRERLLSKSRSGYIQWRGSLLDRALKCVSSPCSRRVRLPSPPADLRHRTPWGCLSKHSLRVPHASSREGINRSDKSIKPRGSLRFRIRRQTISSHADVVALKMWAR